MTELAPKYLAAEHQGLHILFMKMANPVVIYSKTPINTLDDFKGKKIRYASITNKFMLEALGAVPMLVPPQESQDALAKGVVDGAGVPARSGLCLRPRSVSPYALDPPLASATFAMVMNPAKYNSLPPDLRAMLDKESGVAGAMSFGKAWQDSRSSRAKLKSRRACRSHAVGPPTSPRSRNWPRSRPIEEVAQAGEGGQAGQGIHRRISEVAPPKHRIERRERVTVRRP